MGEIAILESPLSAMHCITFFHGCSMLYVILFQQQFQSVDLAFRRQCLKEFRLTNAESQNSVPVYQDDCKEWWRHRPFWFSPPIGWLHWPTLVPPWVVCCLAPSKQFCQKGFRVCPRFWMSPIHCCSCFSLAIGDWRARNGTAILMVQFCCWFFLWSLKLGEKCDCWAMVERRHSEWMTTQ